jgi:hypothetical protein
MNQNDIDAFVDNASTPGDVKKALAEGIPVNGRHSRWGETALHSAVYCERGDLVVALLEAGADANVRCDGGRTSVFAAALASNADILQVLLDKGGKVNGPDSCGQTPLIALVKHGFRDAATRLGVLMRCAELDVDTRFQRKTVEEWAIGREDLAAVVAVEREMRRRWSGERASWVHCVARAMSQ